MSTRIIEGSSREGIVEDTTILSETNGFIRLRRNVIKGIERVCITHYSMVDGKIKEGNVSYFSRNPMMAN